VLAVSLRAETVRTTPQFDSACQQPIVTSFPGS
jgi:hypothetical protein